MSNKFDYHIKKHVDRHEYDVDPQEIWDGILAKQKPKRKRKVWLLLLPLALGVLAASLWTTKNISPSLYTSTSELQSNTKTTPTSELDITTGIDTRTEVYEYNKKTISSTSANKGGNAIRQSVPPIPEKPIAHSKLVSPENQNVVQQFLSTDKKISAPYDKSTPTNLLATNDNKSQESNNLSPQSQIVFLATTELAKAYSTFNFERPIPLLNQLPILMESAPIDIKFQNRGKWSATLTGGYGLFHKSIVSASNDDEAFHRNETERPADFFTTNFLVNYDLNASWSISTGIIYQRAYETFRWTGTYFEDGNGNVINSAEEFTENFNTASFEKVERNIESSYNSYEYLDLPLQIAYRPQLNMKLRTAITASVNANILNTNSGYVVNAQNIPVRLGTVQDEMRVGLRYGLGLSMMLPVSERLGLQLNGLYSFRTNTQRDLSLRYDFQEISLGINYKIN